MQQAPGEACREKAGSRPSNPHGAQDDQACCLSRRVDTMKEDAKHNPNITADDAPPVIGPGPKPSLPLACQTTQHADPREKYNLRYLRSLAFNIAWGAWTALFGLAIPVLIVANAPPRTIRRFTRLWARGFLWLLASIVGLRYLRRGDDYPRHGPFLIIANHQSTWETVAALVLFPDVAIVSKRELVSIPVMGWFLRRSPMILVDRAEGAGALRQMTEASRAAIAEGRSVLIFPEGSRMPVGTPVRFKRGVELLYRTLGVPVLPVVHNSGSFWKLGREPKSSGLIAVTTLKPIEAGLHARTFVQTAQAALTAPN
jgi:1-acyl-sn-glycerol-3-phosphate acyltransferase